MKSLNLRALLVALLLPLAGCAEWSAVGSAVTSAASGQVTAVQTTAQGVNDLNAKAWSDVACATSIGELARNGSGNPNFTAAIFLLCWPQHQLTLPMAMPAPLAPMLRAP